MAHPLLVPLVCGFLHPPPWATSYGPPDPPLPERVAFADDSELADHEVMTAVAGTATSTHFAFKWGPGWEQDDVVVQRVIDAAELAWTLQVDALGFPRPAGTTIARLNIYLANTGVMLPGGAPLESDEGTAFLGYDPEGWPMIVVPPSLFTIDADAAETGLLSLGDVVHGIIAHEFHHATQRGIQRSPANLWWTEGMAEWAALLQIPDFFFSWHTIAEAHRMPEMAVEKTIPFYRGLADLTDDDQRIYGHSYSMAIVPLALSAGADRPDLVVRWSVNPGGHAVAMDGLLEVLADGGIDQDAFFVDLWADLQTGRPHGRDGLQEALAFISENPDSVLSFAHNPTVITTVGAGVVTPPSALKPGRFGANIIRLDAPPDDVVITLTGDERGTAGSATRWGLAAVVCADGVDRCEVVGRAVGTGAQSLSVAGGGVGGSDVVFVPLADSYVDDETFDYRLRADIDDTAVGCTCAGGFSAGLFPVLWITVVAVRRRRKS
jgi:hypothetical protein